MLQCNVLLVLQLRLAQCLSLVLLVHCLVEFPLPLVVLRQQLDLSLAVCALEMVNAFAGDAEDVA
jgi:hypothetical protein